MKGRRKFGGALVEAPAGALWWLGVGWERSAFGMGVTVDGMVHLLSGALSVVGFMHLFVVLAVAVRVVWVRRSTSVSLAWLIILAAFPLIGVIAYVLVGETWLCRRRRAHTAGIAPRLLGAVDELRERFGEVDTVETAANRAVDAIGNATGFIPTLGGNSVLMLDGEGAFFSALIEDIARAEKSCDLLFYIWSSGGLVSRVERALVDAAKRGVRCRVLVDAVGAHQWLDEHAQRLRDAGVQVRGALPVGRLRSLLSRVDLRNHRKIAVIDGRIGYTGSFNMVDPAHFKQDAGVGRWVDLMARVCGPSAALLGALFALDWSLEDGEAQDVESWVPREIERCGDTLVQVAPSGPGQTPRALYRMILSTIHGARERLVTTTPYLVLDEPYMEALAGAVQRGVKVEVVVPEKIDGKLVGLATHACCNELLEVGAHVWAYREGLLHAKTIVADDDLAFVGTMNLDRRSFWLNYEVSLVLHGSKAVREVTRVQERYIKGSRPFLETRHAQRMWARRMAQNGASLFAPLL